MMTLAKDTRILVDPIPGSVCPANTKRQTNDVLMLGQRRRLRTNINPALARFICVV